MKTALTGSRINGWSHHEPDLRGAMWEHEQWYVCTHVNGESNYTAETLQFEENLPGTFI